MLKQRHDGKYEVTKKDSVADNNVIGWLNGKSSLMNFIGEAKATTDTVVFENLDYGYYYIDTTNGTAVTIDTVNTDITVQDKNQEPVSDKKIKLNGELVDQSQVNYGDTIEYVLTNTVFNYVKGEQVTQYVVRDALGVGLENLKIEKVEVLRTDNSLQKTLTEDVDYTVNENVPIVKKDEIGVIVNRQDITIPWATKNGNDDTYNSLYEPISIIKVYCTANVMIGANVGGDKPLINKGSVSWYTPNNPDNPEYTTEEQIVNSYTYGIGIYKTDAKGNALAGAKFTIKDENGNEIKVKAVEGQEGVYNYDPAGSTEVVSPANGIIIVKGLAAEGAYTFHETEAPAGYNVLLNDVTVNATELTHSTTKIKIIKDSEGNITKIEQVSAETEGKDIVELPVAAFTRNIVNNAGTELPSTGGIGTTIFYVIGGILVIGAGILLVAKRRMRGQL